MSVKTDRTQDTNREIYECTQCGARHEKQLDAVYCHNALVSVLNESKATFHVGDRVRLRGASIAYGTVVVQPHGLGPRGTPVVFDGEFIVSNAPTSELEHYHA